jgi:REP element-mobilizing transposase RayT
VSETIVPFASAAAKRSHDAEQDAPTAAIEQILKAMEGMENQIHALIQLVTDQDKRIRQLEKPAKSRIIRGVS